MQERPQCREFNCAKERAGPKSGSRMALFQLAVRTADSSDLACDQVLT